MQRCRYIFLVMILCPLVFAEDVSDESEKRNIIAYHYWNIVHNVLDYAFLDFPLEYQHFWGHSGLYGSIELGRTLPWHDGEDATLIGAALGVMYKFRPVGVSGPSMRTSLGLTALLPDQKNDDDSRFLVYEFIAGYTFRPAEIFSSAIHAALIIWGGCQINRDLLSGKIEVKPILGIPIGFVY